MAERLLAVLAATALTGSACGGSSLDADDGQSNDDGSDGGTAGASSGSSGSGAAPTGGSTSLGGAAPTFGGVAGIGARGGTFASAGYGGAVAGAGSGSGGDAGAGKGGGALGGAGFGNGGTFGGAGFGTGGTFGGAGAGSGGLAACGCPQSCFEPAAVPLRTGGTGGGGMGGAGASSLAGLGGDVGGADRVLPCPPASAVSPQALCGSLWPYNYGVMGPTIQGSRCCYSVSVTCGGGGVGRPFVVEREARVAKVRPRSDWSSSVTDISAFSENERQSLARAWLDDALLEHASIASFARFTLDLLALGAPPELVRGAQLAALDEIEHARLCFGLASRYAGRALGPEALDVNGSLQPNDLVAFALATFAEGAIGETLGALVATEQLAGTTDPHVRAALERIAEDEARHAELAWRTIKWSLAVGGVPVLRAIERAFAEACRDAASSESCSDDGARVPARATWRAHGRLERAGLHALRRQGLLDVVGPCVRALGADLPARRSARSMCV